MSADGAAMGVRARRALGTIISGEEHPTEDEMLKADDFEYMIRSRPLPDKIAQSVWDDFWYLSSGDRYSVAAEVMAHCFLVLEEEDPGVLNRQTFWGPEDTDVKGLWGKPIGLDHAVYEAAKVRWPNFLDKLNGVTGFQVGWAFNAARTIKGYVPAPNPAIVEVG